MSTEAKDGCEFCPNTGVHTGKDATVFLMAVVNVPGKTPVIVTTPRFCKELPANPTKCDICTVVGDLVDNTVIKGAVDIATELRNRFKPQPTDELQTLWGRVSLEQDDASEDQQPGTEPDGSGR